MVLKHIGRSYIIEVLTRFHDVRCPFCLIDLHPSLAQELSSRGKTEIYPNEITHTHKYSRVYVSFSNASEVRW